MEVNQIVRCVISYLLKIILISPIVVGGIETMISVGYGLDPMKVKAYQSSWNKSRHLKTLLPVG